MSRPDPGMRVPTVEAPYSARIAALSVRDPYVRWRHFAIGRGSPTGRVTTLTHWTGQARGGWRAD
jgi:hypothetical protein